MLNNKIRPADRLANERTFLAWIRTAITIIAFGFVVMNFLLPNKATATMPSKQILPHGDNHAFLTGVSFVVIGAVISTLAYVRYKSADKQILTGKLQNSFLLSTLLLVSILLICTLLILYFLETAGHS